MIEIVDRYGDPAGMTWQDVKNQYGLSLTRATPPEGVPVFRLVRLVYDHLQSANPVLSEKGHNRITLWAGVMGDNPEETLSNLEFALNLGVDAGIIAPLYFLKSTDMFDFFKKDVLMLMDRNQRHIPVFLYDNADIAIDPLIPREAPPSNTRPKAPLWASV